MVRPWPASILLVPLGILPRPPIPLVGPLWLLLGDGQREVEKGFEDLGDVLALLTHHGADQLTSKQALNKRVFHLLAIHLHTDTTRAIAVSDSYPHHCALQSGSKGKMCCGKNMGSAHLLVEVNVSFKSEENPSISKGVIERTRHNV